MNMVNASVYDNNATRSRRRGVISYSSRLQFIPLIVGRIISSYAGNQITDSIYDKNTKQNQFRVQQLPRRYYRSQLEVFP